jgi:hypothetical protein
MPVLEIKDSDIGDNPVFQRIAEAVRADSCPHQLSAVWNIWDKNRDCGLSIEAGLLEVEGTEYPVIGVRCEGEVAQYLAGNSCREALKKSFKPAGPDDKYTPGPPLTITE